MSNVNYNNPEAMYPLQTGDRGSPALGAGTVPGSLLAGWNLPDRMNDYRAARDLSNQTTMLGNEHLGLANQDFRSSLPSRESGYNLTKGTNENAIGLLPMRHKLAGIQLGGQVERAPFENESGMQKALNALPDEQRREYAAKLEHIGNIAETFKDENGKWIGDKNMIATEISRMSGEKIDANHIDGISRMLPDIRKANSAFRQQQMTEEHHDTRQKGINETSLEAHRIMAKAMQDRLAMMPGMDKVRLNHEAERILATPPDQRTDADEALLQVWATVNQDPWNKGAAGSQAAGDKMKSILGALDPKKSPPKINNRPPAPEYGNRKELSSEDDIKIKQMLGNSYDSNTYEYKLDPNSATGVVRRKKVKK